MLRACSRVVFGCFKSLEKAGDRLTGAVGPFFVAVAWTLMTVGTVYFFTSVAPSLSWPIISIPLCVMCAANMLMHYYWAWTIPPGTPTDNGGVGQDQAWYWANRSSESRKGGVTWSDRRDGTSDWVLIPDRKRTIKCKKCLGPKPERTHHCRVCKRCVLKYDHHCPVSKMACPYVSSVNIHCHEVCVAVRCFWSLLLTCYLLTFQPGPKGINQCVGLRNERHFVLFMSWFVISTFFFVLLGWDVAWVALDLTPEIWPSSLPQTGYVLIYIICIALGFAVSIMLAWHLYLIMRGESTVENYDFGRYRQVCKERNMEFVNSYDLGRRQNLALFFNVGHGGYPLYTLLLPLRCAPYSDGVSWARKPGIPRHVGIDENDELTDVDDD